MSRSIKFRFWNEKEKLMVGNVGYKGGLVIGDYDYDEHGDPRITAYAEEDDGIIMQYTGFKDKNGTEIYEGDIVSVFCGTQISAVMWNNEYGCWEIKVSLTVHSECWDLMGNHIKEVEVIGNIYENLELLEV